MSVAESFVTVRPDMQGFGGELRRGLGSFLPIARNAGLLIGGAMVGATTALVSIGRSFEDVENTIRVGTGAIGDDLDDLMDDFRAVARDVPAEFDDIGEAVADLNTRLGLTGEPLQDLAGQFLELARITGEDVSGNIESVTRAFGDWDVEDHAGTLDMLFRAAQETGIGVDKLARQLVQFGAPMRSMGFGIEESTALLASFEREGVNAELVMGSLRIALGNFAREGVEDTRGAFEELVANIQDAGSSGEAAALAIEVFGARAGPDMAAAIREGRLSIEDLMEVIESGEDTILDAAEDTRTLTESWQLFKNNAMLALEPIAERVLGALAEGMDRFAGWWQDNGPEIEARAEAVADWLGRVFDAFMDNWPGFQELGGALMELLSALGELTSAVFGDMARIVGSSTEEQSDDIDDLTQGISDLIDVLVFLAETVSRVTSFISDRYNLMVGGLTGDTERAMRAFLNLDERWNRIGTRIIAKFGDVMEAAGIWAAETVQSVRNVVNEILAIPGRIREAINSLVTDMRQAGEDMMQNLATGIAVGGARAYRAAREVVSGIRGLFPSSPAEEGPFSGQGAPELLGESMARQFADGFGQFDVAREVSRVASEMRAALDVPAITVDDRRRGGDGVHIENLTVGSRDDLPDTRFEMAKAATSVAYD